jgi:hypothetical protein
MWRPRGAGHAGGCDGVSGERHHDSTATTAASGTPPIHAQRKMRAEVEESLLAKAIHMPAIPAARTAQHTTTARCRRP